MKSKFLHNDGKGYIYLTTCLINGKIYVGQSIRCEKESHDYLGSGTLIKAAIKKYTKFCFIKRTLCYCGTQECLDTMEEFFIKKFDSRNKKIGYNIMPGTVNGFGRGVPMLIPEVAAKFKKSIKGKIAGKKHFNYGKHLSKETRDNIGKGNKGKLKGISKSKEHCKKIGDAQRGEKGNNFGNKGELSASFGRGYKWCNNGIENKQISIEDNLPIGYVFGYKERNFKHSKERKLQMSIKNSGQNNPMSKTNIQKRKMKQLEKDNLIDRDLYVKNTDFKPALTKLN